MIRIREGSRRWREETEEGRRQFEVVWIGNSGKEKSRWRSTVASNFTCTNRLSRVIPNENG